MTAAAKVAELLDRYGLSLSELDLRGQSCEGSAVETERKRAGPINDCVPATAAFFDCRIWGEKDGAGRLRYVFFGHPADGAAARYLYDPVDQAFTREAALFKFGETYAAMPSNLRRTATNSFQIGLGRGIIVKLHDLRTGRAVALRGSSHNGHTGRHSAGSGPPARWRLDCGMPPPQQPVSWSGVRDASDFGHSAPQLPASNDELGAWYSGLQPTGEDCLSLNVWTASSTGKRPVMVWLHGGAWVSCAGSAPGFDGTVLARDGDVGS